MKNEYQENGVLRGPLILFVPASNLVAILSLDWLDGTERAAVSAKNARLELHGEFDRELRKIWASLRGAQPTRFRYGADNARKLVV
jgi:hypothetical protein